MEVDLASRAQHKGLVGICAPSVAGTCSDDSGHLWAGAGAVDRRAEADGLEAGRMKHPVRHKLMILLSAPSQLVQDNISLTQLTSVHPVNPCSQLDARRPSLQLCPDCGSFLMNF